MNVQLKIVVELTDVKMEVCFFLFVLEVDLLDVKMEAVENKRDGESSVCRRCSLVAARLCAAGDAQHLLTSSHQFQTW